MFLSVLNYEQRKVFLGLTKEILTVDDGVIDQEEEEYLRAVCSEMSLSTSDAKDIEKSEIKNVFSEPSDKRILLLELVALGYSNHDYHELQDKYTDEICIHLGFPLEELRKVEGLLKLHDDMQSKFFSFIEG